MDLTNKGKCSRCGGCCSNFIPLTAEEKVALHELAHKPDTLVQIKYNGSNQVMMLCPFLIANNENSETYCSIYEERPSICRYFKCDQPHKRLSAEEASKYRVTDLMKDIVNYDYQKETGLTYEEAMKIHYEICKRDNENLR